MTLNHTGPDGEVVDMYYTGVSVQAKYNTTRKAFTIADATLELLVFGMISKLVLLGDLIQLVPTVEGRKISTKTGIVDRSIHLPCTIEDWTMETDKVRSATTPNCMNFLIAIKFPKENSEGLEELNILLPLGEGRMEQDIAEGELFFKALKHVMVQGQAIARAEDEDD